MQACALALQHWCASAMLPLRLAACPPCHATGALLLPWQRLQLQSHWALDACELCICA